MSVSKKKDVKNLIKKADLLILDIDNTLVPHLTVGLANKMMIWQIRKVFLSECKKILFDTIPCTKDSFRELFDSMFRRRLKLSRDIEDYVNFFILGVFGITMYAVEFGQTILNYISPGKPDNKVLVVLFVEMVKACKINLKLLPHTKKEIDDSFYPGLRRFLGKFKAKRAAISQSFVYDNIGAEVLAKLLNIKFLHCNKLLLNKDGTVKEATINITSSADKKRIAKGIIKKNKAKNVAVIVNDYEDLGLTELAKLVIMKEPPLRMKHLADVEVRKNYNI